ncbi:class I SAM-dependent methyltransferase [Cytobacillus praedii]|uniref:class I SAM-dependent methyltransferase n=1 Tax=Cytobacillus praedii TaxID=1742358 RepID=UPI003F80708F
MTQQKEHWKEFFGNDYLLFSEDILTPERTAIEVENIIKILDLPKGSKILDLGCGQGRLAIPLALHGYQITALDGSEAMITEAKKRAKKADVEIQFIFQDMRDLNFEDEFDAVINMGTAFGYLNDENADQDIIRNVYRALKTGGVFLLETENRELKTRNKLGKNHHSMNGTDIWTIREFDCVTSRWKEVMIWYELSGEKKVTLDLRLYSATELIKMNKDVGFNAVDAYGSIDLQKYTLTSPRLIIISNKRKNNDT